MATRYQQLLDQAARINSQAPLSPMSTKVLVAKENRTDQLTQLVAPPVDPEYEAEQRRKAEEDSIRAGEFLAYGRPAEQRGLAETVGDFGLSVGSSLTGIAGGLAALTGYGYDMAFRAGGKIGKALGGEGPGITTNISGAISKGSEYLTNYMKDLQSDPLQGRRQITDAYGAARRLESNKQAEQEKADGVDPLVAGFRQVGRGVLNAVDRLGQDGAVAADDLVGAAASILAVGPISKGVNAAIQAPVNTVVQTGLKAGPQRMSVARALEIEAAGAKAGQALAVPGAIGLMEGGAGFTATMNEVMGIPEEELLANSSDYRQLLEEGKAPEEARIILAQNAAGGAALGTGVVGGLAGTLVSKFEAGGLRGVAAAGVGRASVREAIEEGIQGGAQPLMTNIAIRNTADETRDGFQDVGEGLGEGAVLGSMTAGLLAGPGSAARGLTNTAAAIGQGAAAGLREIADPVRDFAYNAAEKIKNRREGVSSTVEQEAAEVSANAPAMWADIKTKVAEAADDVITPEAKQKINDVTDKLANRVTITEQDIDETDPPEVQEAIKNSSNRFDAVKGLAKLVESNKAAPETRVAAAASMARMIRDNAVVQDEAAAAQTEVEKLGETAQAGFQQVTDLMTRMVGSKRIQRALGLATSIMENVKPTKASTPENIKLITAQAELAPDKLDPETGENLLLQSEKGEVDLTPQQATSVRMAVSISRAAQQYKASRPNKATTIDAVSQALVTDDMKPGESLSAVTQARLVTEAIRSGNTDGALQQLNRLRRFGELFQNKLTAINEHYRTGDGTESTAVEYQNLTKKGVWRPETLWVNGQVPQSVTLAQAISADEQLVRKLTNDLITEYPQLGFEPLPEVTLDEELQGDIDTVTSTNRRRPRPFQREAAPVTQPKIYRAQAEASAAEMEQRQAEERAKKEKAAAAAPRKKVSDAKIRAAEAAGQQALPLEDTGTQTPEAPAPKLTDREQMEATVREKEPPRPSNFIQTLRGILEAETGRKGTNVRISAEDAIDAGVPAELIYNKQKSRNSRYRTVKVGLTDIFATRRGPLDTKAAPAILRSLDMGDQVDLEAYGLEGQTEAFTPEDLASLITTSLEGDSESFNKSDPLYGPYMEWQARIADAQEALDKLDETAGAGTESESTGTDSTVEAAPAVPEATDAAVGDLFPNVIGYFKTTFKAPKEPKTRTLFKTGALETAFDAIRYALESMDNFEEFLGDDTTKQELTEDAASEYQELMDKAQEVKDALIARMEAMLAKPQSKANEGKTWEQILRNGDKYIDREGNELDPFLMPNTKPFNLLEERDGKLQYNENMLENAVLAGIQWVLSADQFKTKKDHEDIGEFFGVDENNPRVGELFELMNTGLSNIEAKRSLANMIKRYWGLSADNSQDQAIADGMAESMAAEIIKAMTVQKNDKGEITSIVNMIETEDATMTHADGLPATEKEIAAAKKKHGANWATKIEKTSKRYIPWKPVELDDDGGKSGLRSFISAIEEAVMKAPEKVFHIGEAPKQLSSTQMNNPRVKNTKKQMAALRNDSSIPYTPNGNIVSFYQQATKEGIVALLGEGDLSERKLNRNHRDTLKGRNLTLEDAFDTLQLLTAQMKNAAKKAGKTFEEMEIFYAHNFSSVGRMQMLGPDNPQASKLMREAFLPTGAKLDLTDPKQMSALMLAVGQLMHIKVHNMSREASAAKVLEALDGDLKPAVDILRTWLKSGEKITPKELTKIRETFTDADMPLDPMSLHALMDFARMKNAEADGTLKEFQTQLYIEADGVTNGPMNGIMMVTTGGFTADWVNTVSKGGVFFHAKGWTMNKHRSGERGGAQGTEDKVDLYEKATEYLKRTRAALVRKFAGNTEITGQITAINNLMGMFLSGAKLSEDGRTITFTRAVSKNPLTITLYGSGAKGIAANVVGEIVGEVYAKMSKALEDMEQTPGLSYANAMFADVATETKTSEMWLREFSDSMNTLTQNGLIEEFNQQGKRELQIDQTADNSGRRFVMNAGRLGTRFRNAQKGELVDLESFKFQPLDIENMTQNMMFLFVNPMVEAIEMTVGTPVIESMRAIQEGTNIVSLFLKSVYDAEIIKASEGLQKGTFLSRDEQQAIFDKHVLPLAPFLTNEDAQTFYVAGADKLPLDFAEFGRDLDGDMRTDGEVQGVGTAGVSGTPTMIIGMGDGYMMQLLSTVYNKLQKNLKVFDGINISLDNIEEGARLANQAAFEAMMNNPLQVVADNFDAFMKNVDVRTISPALREDLIKSVFPRKEWNANHPDQEIQWALEAKQRLLRRKANSIEARHNVMRRVRMTIDQMAAVGVPYEKDGDINLEGMTNEQIAARLDREYWVEYAKLMKEGGTNPSFNEVMSSFGSKIGNVVEASQDQLKSMVSRLPLSEEQRSVLQETLSSLIDQDYRVVVGARSDLQDFAAKENLKPIKIADKDSGEIFGYVSLDEKIIYVMNGSAENLVHEMIHASTFTKVEAFYKGDKVPQYVPDAVKRLEALMGQFLTWNRDSRESLTPEEKWAVVNAQAAIDGYLNGKDTPRNKAAALNEFMAWSLSNQALLDRLGKTAAVKEGTVANLAKKVLGLIKKLVFGNRALTKPADDMLSNIRFNTNIIAYSDFTEAPGMKSVGNLLQSAAGLNSRMERFTDAMGVALYERFENFNLTDSQIPKSREERLAHVYGNRTARMLHSNGFPLSPEEFEAVSIIAATMSTAAKLDANVLNEMQDLFTHAVKNLKLSDFAPTGPMDEQVRNHIAQQRFDAINGNLTSRKDVFGRSTLLSSFLALSVVNEDFRKILEGVPAPKTEIGKWQGTNQILDNIGILGMDKVAAAVSGADRNAPNVRAALEALQDQMMNLAEARETRIEELQRTAGTGFTALNDGLVNSIKDSTNKLFEKSEELAESDNALEKALGHSGMFMASIVNEDRSADSVMLLMQGANKGKLPHPVFDLLNEFVGRTPDNARVYDMIKLVRSMVQQLRQKFREDLPRILDERYSRPLTKDESELLFRGLAMTDLAALFGDRTEAQILDLLKDPSTIAAAISEQEDIIRGIDSRKANLLLQKSKELAEFMNHRTVSGNLLRNATAVANLWNEPNVRQPRSPSPDLIKAIDQLTSLYALDDLSQEQKTALTTLVNEQTDGVTFTMSYLVGQRIGEQEKVDVSNIARNNHYKGYIPAQPSGGNRLMVDLNTVDKRAELEALGYEYMGSYVGSDVDTSTDSRGYYFTPIGRPMFNQGIIQNVRSTASGVDPNTGLTNMYSTAGAIMSPRKVKDIIDEMRADPLANGTSDEPLMPVFGANGRIVAFERSVDPLKEALLERDMNLSKAIGQWRGRQAEEGLAAHYNSQLVSKLKAIYDEQKLFRSAEFVNLAGPIADPVVADAVKLINQDTWKLIEEEFGEGEFWVRRDMLNDVIGYRQASIGDIFTGISRLSPTAQKALKSVLVRAFGVEAYRKAMGAEQLLKNFVTDARVTIVVKSVIVPVMNLAANFIQLMSRGVPIADIMKNMPKKTAEVKAYVEGRARLIEVEAEIRASAGNPTGLIKLNAEKQAIEDAQRRMSIWPLIEAGEFASISDVGISQEEILLSSGRLNAYVESMTDKLPDAVKTLGKYAIVAKDTSLYKGLQRAVEYGDFLGKAVLYDYLTETKDKTQEEALASITEEFVNYDRLPGRSRGYLEAVGLMWFWNFKIRSTKIALSMIRNNPLHAMLAMGPMVAMGTPIPGSPIFDNAGSILMDPQRMSYSLGVDQALSAHNLNPWWNLFT